MFILKVFNNYLFILFVLIIIISLKVEKKLNIVITNIFEKKLGENTPNLHVKYKMF